MKFKSLDYIIIVVDDINVMLEFYTKILGLELSHNAGEYAQMKTGDTRLGFYKRNAMSRTIRRDVHKPSKGSYGFEIGFKVDDVDAVYKSLLEKGVKGVVEPEDRPWGQRTAYISDPENNLIEIAQDHG